MHELHSDTDKVACVHSFLNTAFSCFLFSGYKWLEPEQREYRDLGEHGLHSGWVLHTERRSSHPGET